MAERKLIVQIIGDDESLRRAYRRSSSGAKGFDRDLSRITRGALAGSGVFRGLGRSIAFASGGFLAFATAGQFLRASIDAAKEAQVTQKQLAAQFKASGQDLNAYQAQIDKTANSLSLLSGFQNDEIKAGFTTIFRTTGNVTKALRDTATAADLARAKHLSFAQASLIIAKTEAGNTTLLRRQGFQIAKNAKAEDALARLRRIVAGQARAGTTAQERFGAVLHNTEEIIGTGLLPTLNRYLSRLSVWLTQMNESGRLQKDVNLITHDVERGLHDLGVAAKFARDGIHDLNKITGSSEHSIVELGIAWLLFKRRSTIQWVLIRAGLLSTGTAATTASAEVATLSSRLAELGRLGVITVGIEVLIHRKQVANAIGDAVKNATGSNTLGNLASIFENKAIQAQFDPGGFILDALGIGHSNRPAGPQKITRSAPPIFRGFDSPSRFAPPSTGRGGRRVSLQGLFNIAELKLANAQLTETTADDRVILVTEAAIVKQQLLHVKTLKDRTSKTQQLAGILSQIRGIDQADAQAAKDAAAAAKQRFQDALQAREFLVLGLNAQGQPFNLLPGLRSELKNVKAKIAGTSLDTKKNEGLLGNITKLLFGKDAHRLTADVRSTVKQMLDTLQDALKNAGGPETKFQKANTKKLLAGLGLDPGEIKAVRARLSQVGAGGTVPIGSAGASGGKQPDIVLHATFQLDGRTVAVNTTRHQQKSARRNPGQRRGPHAGA